MNADDIHEAWLLSHGIRLLPPRVDKPTAEELAAAEVQLQRTLADIRATLAANPAPIGAGDGQA